MTALSPLRKAELPHPPVLRKLLGPSFILLGLGLGSGELVLWPYLVSNWGVGIAWGAVLGITFQFFMNMEIERYALVNGESIFVGFARKLRLLPLWFILSTLIPWMWPGIIGSAAVLLAAVLGFENIKLLSIALLLLVGAILTLGPVLYKTEELVQKLFIVASLAVVLLLVFWLASPSDWQTLGQGIFGRGEGYWFLPQGIPLASFLAAFAFAGAGGNLNLAQSFYVKEKGYGMGVYSGRITSILTGKEEAVSLEGTTFDCNPKSLDCFARWWKLVNIEHALVFWLTGALTILLLSLLAYTTVFGSASADIGFILEEAAVIGQRTLPFLGTAFLLAGAGMLFSTQLGVMDTTSRVLTENLSLASPGKFPARTIRRNFYLFLWLQVLLGVLVFAFELAQPLTLLILAAVLNAGAMFVHIGLTLWLNLTSLHPHLRPSVFRIAVMFFAFLFFGAFSLFTFLEVLN